nr:hypothetical protein C5F59_37010 [Streptomyces sp. QL37]
MSRSARRITATVFASGALLAAAALPASADAGRAAAASRAPEAKTVAVIRRAERDMETPHHAGPEWSSGRFSDPGVVPGTQTLSRFRGGRKVPWFV